MPRLVFALALVSLLITEPWDVFAQTAPIPQTVIQQLQAAEARRDFGGLVGRIDELLKGDPNNPLLWANRSSYLSRQLRYEEAIQSAQKSIAIAPGYSQGWTTLGIALWRLGRRQEAIDALRESARLDPQQLWTWINLWGLLTEAGVYSEIPDVINKVKALSPEAAISFTRTLGAPEKLAERSNPAKDVQREAADQCRSQGKDAALKAIADGKAALSAGDASRAVKVLNTAVSDIKETACRFSPDELMLRDLLLIAHLQSLEIPEALAQHVQTHNVAEVQRVATAIAKELENRFGKASPQYLRAELANVYLRYLSGDFPNALGPALDAYIASEAALGQSDKTTQWLKLMLGVTYSRLNRYDNARPLLVALHEQAKLLYGDTDPLTWLAFDNVSQIDKETGKASGFNVSDAILAEKCSQIFGPSNSLCLEALGSLAYTLGAQGKTDAAEDVYNTIRARLSKAYGENSPDMLALEYSRANMFYKSKQFPRAQEILDKLVPSAEQLLGRMAPLTLRAKLLQAYVDISNNKLGEASAIGRQLIKDVELLRADLGLSPADRQQFLAQYVGLYMGQALGAYVLNPDEAFRVSELAKARTLLDSIALSQANRSGVLGASDQATVDEFEKRIQEIGYRLNQSSGPNTDRLSLEQQLRQALQEYSRFRKDLKERNPRYSSLTEFSIVSAREGVEKVLDEDTAFVSFLVSNSTVLGFALSKNEGLYVSSVAINNIEATVEALRNALSENGSSETTTRLAKQFGDALLKPFAKFLANKRRLVVSPDGPLAFVPFEVLEFNGQKLIDSIDVSYSPSLSVLALTRERDFAYAKPDSRKQLFAMGGAEYDLDLDKATSRGKPRAGKDTQEAISTLRNLANERDAAGKTFRRMNLKWENLPGTKKEVEAVAKLFGPGQSAILTGRDASEFQLQRLNKTKELSQYRYLLFSAHGYLSPEEPSLSAIVLSQIEQTPEADGYVTVSEWPTYDLRSDLIVMSACDTGVGKFVQGEGVLGLPYALYVAGNKNLLLTLWPIDDEATEEFMHEFFVHLNDGDPASRALAKTKRSFMRSNLYSEPRFWAPFVLYGY